MELWDIYDSNKKRTGRTMKRNDWQLKDGEYHLTVLGIVVRSDGKFLITKRVMTKVWASGWWEVSGGAAQAGEDSKDAVIREVREETGLELVNYQFRGIVTFISDKWEDEYMCLYTADKYIGEIGVCDEGELVWVEKDKIKDLNIWEGDKIFLRLLAENELFFSLKLEYQGENLINAILNGKEYN